MRLSLPLCLGLLALPPLLAAADGGAGLRIQLRAAERQFRQGERDPGAFEALVRRYESGEARTSEDLAAVAAALVHLGRDDPGRFRDALRVYDEAVAADPSDLGVQVELGDLFLAKYNALDARRTYESVLADNPEHPRALLGLAKVRRFDGASDVTELVERSLAADPDLVEARLLLSRQALDFEDYVAAEELARRALETEPDSDEAHALLVAAALLAGDEKEAQRRLARLAEVAPYAVEAFVTLAEVAARNRLYHRAVTFADRAVAVDGKCWRGLALRGINRLRIGEIAGGRKDLEAAFAGDPFDVWTKNTLDLLDVMDGYEVRDTERFRLVVPAGEADLLNLYLVPLVEEAYRRMRADYGVELPAPVRLEVFPRHADFSVRTIGLVGLGALGVSFGPVVAVDSPSARPAGEFHWGAVVWHELAHSFHMELSASRVPRWFTEGLASFEERRARPGWGDRVTVDFLAAYLEGRLAPVEDLNQGFLRPAYPRQVVFTYYQASLVFDFLVERWGFGAVVAMLHGYGEGQGTPELVRSVLGLDLAELAGAYDEYFRQRFAVPLASLRPAEDDPEGFFAHLAAGRSLVGVDDEAAAQHLERAKLLFPSLTEGESPYFLLAGIHLRAGRLEEAERELAALVERNQAHLEALLELAEVRRELGDLSGAVRALASAQYVYPFTAEDHQRLAGWLRTLGEDAPEVRERRAVLALAPFNRPRALYELALAQRDAGDPAGARSTVLEALEQAPNYEEALELLLELRSAP